MARLTGKFALITGGSSGIGLETARQFMAEGAIVAITGRDEAALARAKEALGADLITLISDAGNIAGQAELAQAIKRLWGRLDILFINAGDVTHLPLADWNEATYQQAINTNFSGPFFLIQKLLPLFTRPSSIILCGSTSVHIGLPQSSVYAASKAALLSLARTLSGELIGQGIRVNGLSPGPTDTPAMKKLGLPAEEEAALRKTIVELVPAGELGSPADIAHAAVYLASDESRFMVGTEMLVDGGVANL
ncbi:NAD(P)-dependent dehydrogenase (short-subunit alcohol dehydrogenase family) [Enterobacter sp. BIGb0383]|uniref:SDR family oxidoreductase n=1 Tax=unclassified Enterobacter TaxID=2608935 RepID=UPI000F47DA9E|nr:MULTISPECIES: SDR family oxidoreductase [unclassified Enterobacter]ROP61988.1 NAD(P)-dependent dehydrogenase (short-subunit alcohol dehydrogenase family) [Enterobacter sp. BIGb0383]ROS12149.1 NAD(P)-dependent dehydrogenase (short-subunit alcohol dehydrogenase family) [Enterobacter sp. BIGb0359]